MPDTIADESRTAEYLTAGHVDGALLVSLHANDPLPGRLTAAGIPFVMVGRPPKGIKASFVDVDNRQGAQSAVAHLIASGRRVIATIAGPKDMAAGVDRLMGYRDALADAGLAVDPSLEVTGDFTQEGGATAMGRLLEARPDIDAVFAASDLMAAGALAVLAADGRRVPADVAVVGFDDSPVATTTMPAAHQRPPTDRSDGPRDGPPACRCRRGLRSRATARDPGHRTGTARIERREAVALSRPATGGRCVLVARTSPHPAPVEVGDRVDLDTRRRDQDATVPIQARARLLALMGLVAIVASACSGATASTAPSAAATTAPTAAAAATATPPPAVTPPPLVGGRPRPQRWRRRPLVRRSRRRRAAAAARRQKRSSSTSSTRRRRTSTSPSRSRTTTSPRRQLKTQIAAGNAPDIIGPVGVEGLNLFRDHLLDLAPLIAKTGYNVPGVDPKLVDFFKLGEGGATIGVPYAVYPSFIYYNKDLFDEARPALPADQGR